MIDDGTATDVIDGILELAIAVRDLGPEEIRAAAAAVLQRAGGDPAAALTVAAALVPVDRPVDTWWQRTGAAHQQAIRATALRFGVSTDIDCKHPGHRSLRRHEAAEQKPCRACLDWQAAYRRDRRAARRQAAA